MFEQNIDYFRSKPVFLPKITILVDHGYHPEKLTQALEQIYPQIMTKIQFELESQTITLLKKKRMANLALCLLLLDGLLKGQTLGRSDVKV
jgi:ethanolamine ammonia-lyase small subunit